MPWPPMWGCGVRGCRWGVSRSIFRRPSYCRKGWCSGWSQCADLGLDLEALTIEITEDALLNRVAGITLGQLAALRSGGARLALDDFGPGTSGLAQLLRLPLGELKLGRTFTRNLGRDRRAKLIVEGTIRLAGSMGLRVVAEGIENEAPARQLHELFCHMGQGWLHARAIAALDLRDWLGARQANSGNYVWRRKRLEPTKPAATVPARYCCGMPGEKFGGGVSSMDAPPPCLGVIRARSFTAAFASPPPPTASPLPDRTSRRRCFAPSPAPCCSTTPRRRVR